MSTSVEVAPSVTRARAIRSKSRDCAEPSRASTAPQVTGETRPTMPKSMKPTRPSGSTSRLPARQGGDPVITKMSGEREGLAHAAARQHQQVARAWARGRGLYIGYTIWREGLPYI